MVSQPKIGERVEVYFGDRFGEKVGWYPGTVFKIEPYSNHRGFYWVDLDPDAQAVLGITQISVFNPKNIRRSE